ncbi:FabD/lysophospholipase-like protein [Amniculicola lignicola CBS 123094]|uniref:FabD/lysophospholipase-like protein n=1 Tax=Amniculicola lignicola CBS 123094 TaxID=1392246 RepID=A0A6A5WS81_9PLEO|nr:FabD/lysophospholipase-like protein [Amniculicola lignicola CBS 123094]
MSWTAVDFSTVRYSPIEGTHYFYDPANASSIQFLINGRWEPWDVGWVARKALDADIRRIAEDAETRLRENCPSGYLPWPSSPTLAASSVDGQPTSARRQSDYNGPLYSPAVGESALSPTVHNIRNSSLSPELQPTHGQGSSSIPPSQPPSYVSPYAANQPPGFRPNSPHGPGQPPEPPPQAIDPGLTNAAPQHPTQSPTGPGHVEQPQIPIPIPPPGTRETKIMLNIDGDGIRGLSAVLLIESLVNAVCGRLGQRVDPYQIFDLIGGASTGGLFAILIGRLRMQPHKAREDFVNLIKAMYKDKMYFFRQLNPNHPVEDDEHRSLEVAARAIIDRELDNTQETFFDDRSDSTNVFIISTQVDIGTNRPAVIRSFATRRVAGPEIDPNITVQEALNAAAAAPRYFDPQGMNERRSVIEPGLVDYGTTKNSPIRDLFFECRKLYSYSNDTMVLVTVGPGEGFNKKKEMQEMGNHVEDRAADANNSVDKFQVDNAGLIETGWMKFFRFNVPDLEEVPLEEWNQVDALMAKTHAYLGRPDVGVKFYACVDAIADIVSAGAVTGVRAEGIMPAGAVPTAYQAAPL